MKPVLLASLLMFLLQSPASEAATSTPAPGSGEHKIKFVPAKGKLRIEGTSSMDDWQVEARSFEGSLEACPGFLHPGQRNSSGQAEARVDVLVEVNNLKSIEKDGKPFSNKMDDIMHDSLKGRDHPQIRYQLDQLVLKRPGKGQDAPSEYDARGHLAVAGVTNEISMPVRVAVAGSGQIKIWGSAVFKMTDFNIEPPSPKIALGLIKTGDEIKISFDWTWVRRD